MLKLQLALSRIAARLHRWPLAVFALTYARIAGVDENTRRRLSYACILARASPMARKAFARILRRNLDQSAAINLWLAYTAWCFARLNLSRLINRRTAARYPSAPEAAIALREASFAASITDGTLNAALAKAAASLDASTPGPASQALTIVPVSSRYLDLFHLWNAQRLKHFPGPLLILALDPVAATLLPQAGTFDLSSYFGFDSTGRIEDYSKRHLWILRVFILHALVARGHTVLSLDLDAVFVADLAPLLAVLPAADIIVQQDYSIPVDVARQLGFILCCGFFRIESNPATIAFLERYAQATAFELDDQTALNHLLAASGLEDKLVAPTHMSFKSLGLSWVCPDPTLISRDLDHGTVLRHFQQTAPLDAAQLSQRLGIASLS